jgi:hypothetical protein
MQHSAKSNWLKSLPNPSHTPSTFRSQITLTFKLPPSKSLNLPNWDRQPRLFYEVHAVNKDEKKIPKGRRENALREKLGADVFFFPALAFLLYSIVKKTK